MTPVALRTMLQADILQAIAIVAAHSATDGRLAERYFRAYFRDADRVRSSREQSVVAVRDSQLVGVATFAPDKYDWPDILWLEWLFVEVACRGQGIGSALLGHVLNQARRLRTRKLYLNTDSTPACQPAVRLYTRFGFVEEGRLRDYYGAGYHSIVMGLPL